MVSLTCMVHDAAGSSTMTPSHWPFSTALSAGAVMIGDRPNVLLSVTTEYTIGKDFCSSVLSVEPPTMHGVLAPKLLMPVTACAVGPPVVNCAASVAR